MDDLLNEFLAETTEGLALLDTQMVSLEQNPNDTHLLGSIFRVMHTIKGTCGFLGLPRLESVAHAAENILGKFRDGVLPVTPEAVSLILQSVDTIKVLLESLAANGREPDGDDAAFIAVLNAHAQGAVEALPAAPLPPALEEATITIEKQEQSPPASTQIPQSVEVKPKEHGEAGAAAGLQSIRVNVDVLENLMTMVSELVLTRNQLNQILRAQRESPFTAALERLNHITSEIQESVMKTRMQPIGNAWSKLPRIVRDLSQELVKKIDLIMLGAETELDRQVLELIKDPLTHMVRNSADHGLESPEQRRAAGKPETGHITLRAYHEGGYIIIEISDDGRGLPLEKIKAKIIANKLASESELAVMSESQIQQFIFKAGFSTAAAVTSVSGRGVGMDVVKTNIEKIGGTIDLYSKEGLGSRFTIKIPLTLAIVSALIVACHHQRYALPQISVLELLRVGPGSDHKMEMINSTPVLRLRGHLLPLLSLRKALAQPEAEQPPKNLYIIVMQSGSTIFGLIVDQLFDTEEIVVKPVSMFLRDISLYSGNTILGDGSVVMILDPNGLAALLGHAQAIAHMNDEKQDAAVTDHSASSLMLFRAGDGAPKVVPLSLVSRLEDMNMGKVEEAGGQRVIQYHGKLMPLIPMNDNFVIPSDGDMPVLVFSEHDRSMGLIVQEILDVVESSLKIDLRGKKPGFLGSAIIDGKASDVIDASYYLSQAYADWLGSADGASYALAADKKVARRVLLVDDSAFFRNLLLPLLNIANFQVVAVSSPKEAMTLCAEGEVFDAIVTDLEMPETSGFEFAGQVRQTSLWGQTPIIALTSHNTKRDVERCRAAGITEHVPKFDRDRLLETLSHLMTG